MILLDIYHHNIRLETWTRLTKAARVKVYQLAQKIILSEDGLLVYVLRLTLVGEVIG